MIDFRTSKEVLEFMGQLRKSHANMRCVTVAKETLGLLYANGKHWTTMPRATQGGKATVDSWNEKWDPHSNEIRVTDNRTGPLVRRIAAETNATSIDASVTVPQYLQSTEANYAARISQNILNGIGEQAGFTRAARGASSLRWKIGSSIVFLRLSKKKQAVSDEFALNPDGSPVEIDDQWLRWDFAPLSDMIWEPSNYRRKLEDHNVLMFEQALTKREFEQIYGPIKDYGFDEADLPKLGEIAPHKASAAGIGGGNTYGHYSQQSESKALRVVELFLKDPSDPNAFPRMFRVIDTSPPNAGGNESGNVVNFDNPESPFGNNGLPFVKLDGYQLDDSVWSQGLPHIVMDKQNLLNIGRSIQFQQMVSQVFGRWLIDKSSTNRENFVNNLGEGVGSVIEYDSRQNQHANAPQFITPKAPANEFITISADLGMGMRDAVHLSAAQLGAVKSHVSDDTHVRSIEQAGAVTDNIIIEDGDSYGSLLKTTLGTTRSIMERPNRMLARLNEIRPISPTELQAFLTMPVRRIPFLVRVRKSAITSRNPQQRKIELQAGVETQLIDPYDVMIELSEVLEEPITAASAKEIQYIKMLMIQIVNGQPFEGDPFVTFPLFHKIARDTIHDLDPTDENHSQKRAMLMQAIQKQQVIEQETNPNPEQQEAGQQAGSRSSSLGEVSLFPTGGNQGAPESINPVTNPVGAAGGLPLGLS